MEVESFYPYYCFSHYCFTSKVLSHQQVFPSCSAYLRIDILSLRGERFKYDSRLKSLLRVNWRSALCSFNGCCSVYILPLYYKLDHGCTSILLCPPHRIILLALLTVGLFMSRTSDGETPKR